MLVPFRYERIGQVLIEELEVSVERGESILLMGPRYIGKRYLLQSLCTRFQERFSLVKLQFLKPDDSFSDEEFWKLLAGRFGEALNTEIDPERLAADLPGTIRACSQESRSQLVISAANIDALPDYLARTFLQALRVLIQSAHPVVAILSAEADPRGLVHGENSEFNCANQIVIQGLDQQEFAKLAREYCATLRVEVPQTEAFFTMTGGNMYLFRTLVWDLTEICVREKRPLPEVLESSEVENVHNGKAIFWTWKDTIFRHTAEIVESDNECIRTLTRLMRDGYLDVEDNAPHRIELSGIAVRREERLVFSSPLMERFVRDYYKDRRLGNLFALHQQWDDAFGQYRQCLEKSDGCLTRMDVLRDTEAALRSLHASLHGEVVNSPDDVWHLFTNGIRYMLGLPHVLLVIRSNDGEKWQIARQEEDVPPDAFKRCCRMLTEAKITPDSPESISRENGATLIARLPGERPMMEQAVLVGDLTDGAFLSRERTRLAMDLLEQFVSAYVQACALSRERQRLEIREKHIDIIDRILDSLGSEVSRVDQVLKKAAVELRHLGYRRVAFSLVDPGQKRIVGVVDASDGPNTAELTDYPLDDLNADVECYVFHNKRPVRIADARACADFPVSKRVVFKAGIIGMAIIPMILHEQVIGNMHVEREDQEEPTEEEVEDLTLFAKHLAVAIVQSEQVEMLQSALNQLPDPLVIVDRQRRIRYANRPGEDSFGISAGWQARPVDIDCAPSLEGEYTQTIGDAMDKKQQLVRFMEIDSGKSRDRISFAVAPISDWNGQINGALVHVRNITYLHSLLDAFKFAGAAEGAQELLEALLEGSRVLMERKGKHLWGRLYLVDPYDENYLIGYAQYGLSDEEAQAFEMGEIRLQRSDDRHNESWWCIDDRAPKVYSWSDKRKDREEYTTPFGLPVINLIKPSCPLMVGKRPGDQWIDFPLWARDRDEPVGKISLDCPENLDPYDFEWLHLLAEVASALIEASLRRKELESEKAKWFRKAAENAIGEIAHHIIGRHAALGTLLFRYCQREKELPELENLNRDFERMLGKIDRDVQRASNQLRPKDLDKERTDVVGLLRELFEDSLPPSPFQFRSSDDVIWAEVDREEVEHIFQELFINSRKAQVNGRELLITAELSTFERNDRCWLQVVYSDNGCGIPHNAKESVFKEFVSSDQRPGRTGLGLTIMRRIVEAHGGGIWERGTPGQGAEFVIEFPLAI